jgi:F-type H+-transporting ATPase subunit a
MEEGHASWLAFLYELHLGPFTIGPLHVARFALVPEWVPDAVPFALLCALILGIVSYVGTRRMRRVPRGLQTMLEYAVSGLTNFAQSILGDKLGRDFAPFIGTLFIFILLMNLMGLVPGMKSPTADLNTTAALAIVVFLAVQYFGLRAHGVVGYFKHMVADVLVLPWYLAFGLVPFMLALHLISELVRPLSLAMRLFGNIRGKEVVLGILAGLATLTLALFKLRVGGFEVMGSYVALTAPPAFGVIGLVLSAAIMPLGILMGIIQALVFSLLACLYLSLATELTAEEA